MAYGIPAATRRHLEGKYLQTSDVPAAMAARCSRGELASAFGGELDLVTGKVTTIAGQAALQLAGKRHSMSAYVTISARPEFLRIDVSGQEHTVFTGYNRPLTLTPPRPARRSARLSWELWALGPSSSPEQQRVRPGRGRSHGQDSSDAGKLWVEHEGRALDFAVFVGNGGPEERESAKINRLEDLRCGFSLPALAGSTGRPLP